MDAVYIWEDPLFQKMAALYEHIGDLAAQNDAEATTRAYQEACHTPFCPFDACIQCIIYTKSSIYMIENNIV